MLRFVKSAYRVYGRRPITVNGQDVSAAASEEKTHAFVPKAQWLGLPTDQPQSKQCWYLTTSCPEQANSGRESKKESNHRRWQKGCSWWRRSCRQSHGSHPMFEAVGLGCALLLGLRYGFDFAFFSYPGRERLQELQALQGKGDDGKEYAEKLASLRDRLSNKFEECSEKTVYSILGHTRLNGFGKMCVLPEVRASPNESCPPLEFDAAASHFSGEENLADSSTQSIKHRLIQRMESIASQYYALVKNSQGVSLAQEGQFEAALNHFTTASTLGCSKAKFNLGVLFETGHNGHPINLQKAQECYREAAQLGHTTAAYNLAVYLLQGKAGNVNTSEGLHWMEIAAQGGDTDAETYMGIYYLQHNHPEKGVMYLQRAYLKKDLDAMYHLARCYESGMGVERNSETAASLFEEAASENHGEAAFSLARYYTCGLGGCPVNQTRARQLYTIAAEAGNAEAQHELEELMPTTATPTLKINTTEETDINARKSDDSFSMQGLLAQLRQSHSSPVLFPNENPMFLYPSSKSSSVSNLILLNGNSDFLGYDVVPLFSVAPNATAAF